jgi:hypothetical protein
MITDRKCILPLVRAAICTTAKSVNRHSWRLVLQKFAYAKGMPWLILRRLVACCLVAHYHVICFLFFCTVDRAWPFAMVHMSCSVHHLTEPLKYGLSVMLELFTLKHCKMPYIHYLLLILCA